MNKKGECKQEMDIFPNGIRGYAPLVISLSNARMPLFQINRPGNAPSHLDAAQWIDCSLELVGECFEQLWFHGDKNLA